MSSWRAMGRLGCVTILLALSACGATRPNSFSQTIGPGWTSIEVREDVGRDRAWTTVFGLLARSFDIEFSDRQDGYLRTAWSWAWGGMNTQTYRVRVTTLLLDDGRKLDLRTEAQFLSQGIWISGTDTSLLQSLKSDIMGTIGRTTR